MALDDDLKDLKGNLKPLGAGAASEVGVTGLMNTSGFIFDEILPQLRGLNGAKIYQEMSENDPVLAAFLYAITMVVRQVEWRVDAVDKTPAAVAAQEFVQQVLFEDMTHTWSEFLAEVMSMCVHGYSLFEIVWKIRGGTKDKNPRTDSRFSDNKIGVRRLATRSQLSVWKWLFDDTGEVDGVTQIIWNTGQSYRQGHATGPARQGMVDIPRVKLLLFRTTALRNNPEGRSLLRPSYIPYLRKKTIEDAEGRLALRSAGVVQLKLPGMYFDPGADSTTLATFAAYKTIAAALAQDRTGSIILPSDVDDKGHPLYELNYIVADGRRSVTDTNIIIERLDKRMVMSVMADFLMLGHQKSGSYALAAVKSDLFTTALKSLLTGVAEVINRSLIAKLWAYNGLDEAIMPTLTPGEIERVDLTAMGAFLTACAGAGMPLFPSPTLENAIRDAANWPEVTEDEIATQLVEAKAQQGLQTAQIAIANPSPPQGAPGAPGGGKAPPPAPGKAGGPAPPQGAPPAMKPAATPDKYPFQPSANGQAKPKAKPAGAGRF